MNQAAYPLLTHEDAHDIVAYGSSGPISRSRFLGDVKQLAALLPPGGFLLNACSDRYHFAVGLAAALLSGKVSLLPPALTPEMLNQLQTFAPDMVCLCDDETPLFSFPSFRYPPLLCEENLDAVPNIESQRLVAWIFTSGSTGKPQAHAKTWGSLVAAVRAGALRLGLCDGRRHALVATVPPQHMFGFEVSLLMAWQSRSAFHAGKPFYPGDIQAALAAVPQPRMLVSTPYHLRNWLEGSESFAALDAIVSATAPLSSSLAQALEAKSHARVYEIYGSTETGQLASRRPAQCAEWQLYDGLMFTLEPGRIWVSGGHVIPAIELHDRLELLPDNRFCFLGRSTDMVNIAGKRNSLAYLNEQLNAIAGVEDGVYYMPPEDAQDGVTRLMAFVVAPTLTRTQLNAAMRLRVDPLFLPRPIYWVEALPRDANGKLPLAALVKLVFECSAQGVDQ